ncbi:sensor histidine kinase [Streptomyces reniochalinae]|uniref:sensor histidine kinase n=1 Tax=Streptomyces reniochalinae TaxID=2250578 RepID=UPI001FEA03FF|nr:histidine kinase [Streptomyces reniochalinae]
MQTTRSWVLAAPWANLLLGAAVTLLLLVRRRAPELVLAVGLIAKFFQVSFFVVPLAYYAEGAFRGPHSRKTVWAWAAVGLVALAPWDAERWSSTRTVVTWFTVNFVLTCLVPLLLGLYVGQRRAVVAGLVERAERAEREQRLVAEAARAQERRRIAGEMHDIVSHQVSLIVVHANALSAVSHDPEVAHETAGIIQTAGRRALTELREMLGVLRNGPASAATEAAPAGSDPAQSEAEAAAHARTAPSEQWRAPGAIVDRITELTDSSRNAGLPVALCIEGAPQALAEPVARAVHRVVQEALTNVHKHAPGATTQVRLAFTPESVRVRVVNGLPERPAGPAGGALLPSGGHGLIGLSERVQLAGGTIESGPTGEGGFLIEAALPTAAVMAPAA